MSHRVVMLLSNAFRPDPRVLKEARSLAQAGYDLTVVAWDREGTFAPQETVDGFTVLRVQNVRSRYGAGARQLGRLPVFWRRAWAILNEIQPELVHCHDFDTLPPGWLWAKLHRRRVIYDAHEYYTELQRPRLRGLLGKVLLPAISIAEHMLSRTADAIVTVDERIARRYHNRRIAIIGHFPPVDFISHPAQSGKPGAGECVLVYAGRFSTDRGMLVIGAALQRLAKRGLRPRLRLLGIWTNPAEEQAFLQSISGLEGQVNTVGWVPFEQIAESLSSADIALAVLQPIPRYVAALPVKLFEYMACGLPVVISDFPAVRQVVAGSDCGILVDPADVEAVSQAIEALITAPDLAQRLGQNGRAAFDTRYNWQVLEPILFRVYADLLGTDVSKK